MAVFAIRKITEKMSYCATRQNSRLLEIEGMC